ncbi:MAG: aromatic ring-hydroxylating dioxygenase subunit alpha [Pseudomonadota bacterium]
MTLPNDTIRSVKKYIDLPFAYNHWYVAGLVEEFGRELKARTLLDRSIVFYRTEKGDLVAMQNRCLHRSFPLSESTLDGDNVICGYHGANYGPDGKMIRFPWQKTCPKGQLKTYATKEVGQFVFIWMGAADATDESRFPDLSYLEDQSFRTFYGAKFLEGSYLFMQENLNDLTHFAFLHANTFRFDEQYLELPVEVTPSGSSVRLNRIDTNWAEVCKGYPTEVHEAVGDRKIEKHDGGVSVALGIFKGEAPLFVKGDEGEQDQRFDMYIMHYMTPQTKGSAHYWYSLSQNFGQQNDAFYMMQEALVNQGFDEDTFAVKHMQILLDYDSTEMDEISVNADRAGLLFRKAMLDWVNEELAEAPA